MQARKTNNRKTKAQLEQEAAQAAASQARWAKVKALAETPRFDLLIAVIEEKSEALKEKITEWQVGFTKNPAYALERGREVFEDSARLELYQGMVHEFKEARMERLLVADYLKKIQGRANSKASGTLYQSSSTTSNLMDLNRLKVLAELLENFNGLAYLAQKAAVREIQAEENSETQAVSEATTPV